MPGKLSAELRHADEVALEIIFIKNYKCLYLKYYFYRVKVLYWRLCQCPK
jgi:hypothetical protein